MCVNDNEPMLLYYTFNKINIVLISICIVTGMTEVASTPAAGLQVLSVRHYEAPAPNNLNQQIVSSQTNHETVGISNDNQCRGCGLVDRVGHVED